jgi:hypothetical protein
MYVHKYSLNVNTYVYFNFWGTHLCSNKQELHEMECVLQFILIFVVYGKN